MLGKKFLATDCCFKCFWYTHDVLQGTVFAWYMGAGHIALSESESEENALHFAAHDGKAQEHHFSGCEESRI